MKKYWIPYAFAFSAIAGFAVAQTGPEPTRATNGPAGTVERAHTGIVVDGAGVATGTSDTFKKTQTYTSGDGQLSAKTKIETTGPVTSTGK
jgi:hypothetical protein